MKCLISLLLLSFFYSIFIRPLAAQELINVGIILPLSGEAAAAGHSIKNGIELGYDSLAPERKKMIRLNYEDDGLQARNSVAALNKLASTKDIKYLINASSGTGKALAPLAEQKGITFISIASDKTISENRKHVFNFWVTPEEEIKVALSEMKKRNYKRIAAVYTLHEGALAIKQAFSVANKQFDLVLDAEFDPNVKDFRPFLTKLRLQKDLDGILVVLMPGQCGLFAKQARQFGFKQDLFSIEMFEDPNEVKASGGALVGQWYVQGDDPGGNFVMRYKKNFESQSMWGASNGHDAILLLAAALEAGHQHNNLHQFLANLKNFSGALGEYSSTGDNRFSLPAVIKVVTDSGFEKLYN